MAKPAKPYEEAGKWSMRRRVFGQDLYVCGKKTKSEAERAMKALVEPLAQRGKPKGLGPFKTTVAQALQDMGVERLPFLKGAQQEVRRINRYLRAAGLATLALKKHVPEAGAQDQPASGETEKKHKLFDVELEPPQAERRIPQGLGAHRAAQAKESLLADTEREGLARMCVADVQAYHVQELMDQLRGRRKAATVQLERALLRGFFNHAHKVWCWSHPVSNPAVGLKMPKVDNNRERVMSEDEQRRLDEAIQDCRNHLVGPTLTLLTETAMRSSEPLEYARWKDVDWQQCILRLPDSKNDRRDVPLSPKAIEALQQLAELNPPQPEERIVQMSYEALAAAWRRACDRAGITDLHLHDLRHTSA